MDIVGGPFNHLVPSDQLEDSLLLGQNLECEASDVFEGDQPEDSLKNMLSDKDPMFGSASAQFHLLENEDVSFKLGRSTDQDAAAGSIGQSTNDGEQIHSSFSRGRTQAANSQRRQTACRGRPRGRPPGPTRKTADHQQTEFKYSEIPDEVLRAKRQALLSQRFGVHEVDPSMNPVVVLHRLTVTVGGYKIELLPGPSHSFGSFSTSALQALGFPDEGINSEGLTFDFGQSQDECTQEVIHSQELGEVSIDQSTSNEIPMDFGPYVNPNEVQDTNNPSVDSINQQDTKKNNQIKAKKLSLEKTGKKNGTVIKPGVKTLVKNKPSPGPTKTKPSSLIRPALLHKVHPKGKTHLSKPDSDKVKLAKLGVKRPGTPLALKAASKIQKIQDGHSFRQSTNPSVPLSPRKASSESGVKSVQSPQPSKKPLNSPTLPCKANPSLTNYQTDEEQEKTKIKKPEKIQQRQKNRTSRSISIEEPQLFIPDNAPVVKKETDGDPPPESDTVWDPSKNCALCKKPHSHRFMVGCGRCDDWFHGDCIGLDMAKVQQMEKEDQEYVCLKCCAEENGKPESSDQSDDKSSVKQKPVQTLTAGGIRPFRKDSGDRRLSEDSAQKVSKGKHEMKKVKISPSSSKTPSTGQIRRSVRDSLEEILLKRLKESDLKTSTEKPAELARRTEKELFALFQGVDSKYKNKYRSLTFNLKDTKNNVLYKRVLKGEISPADLVRMTAEELASKELAAWRKRENRHTIEMIEKEQREVERRPITKITHKGEIEIENQEPGKAPEAIEVEPEPVKDLEVAEEKLPEIKPESPKKAADTTSLHKSHLFDLNCKICTGRMAPPTEEATTKVVKVATTVMKRQSGTTDESQPSASTSSSALMDDLTLRAMEEGFLNFSHESRSDSSKEDTATFLSSMNSLWGGFVDMPAVAKFLTKAYPVSGILDHLTQDLPDNIHVGGRISPQIVWDYVEKIRASGTKEICVIRLTPDTEEDEISYTLLYAYFSSRRRYGVVANNRKQVKDMYLIPLGSTEKIPHQIVPFDGPGLETNRPNLLLGLVIRQRPKRDFATILPSDMNEAPNFFVEIKSQVEHPQKKIVAVKEERSFISELGNTTKKDTAELIKAVVEEAIVEPETNENVSLRFLPGVLKSPNNAASSSNDYVKNDLVTKTASGDGGNHAVTAPKPPSSAPRLDRFIIRKKDSKTVKPEQATTTFSLESSIQKKRTGITNLHNKLAEGPAPSLSNEHAEGLLSSLSNKPPEGHIPFLSDKPADGVSTLLKEKPLDGVTMPPKDKPSDGVTMPPKDKPSDGVTMPPKDKPSDGVTMPSKDKPSDGVTTPLKDKTADGVSTSQKDIATGEAETSQKDKIADGITTSLKDKPADGFITSKGKHVDEVTPSLSNKPADVVMLSLSDKPADVSTESFLSSLSSSKLKKEPETSSASSPVGQETRNDTLSEVSKDSISVGSCSKNERLSMVTIGKASPSDILKRTSLSVETIETKPNVNNSEKTLQTVQPTAQGNKAIENIQTISTISSIGKNEGLKQPRIPSFSPKIYNPPVFHSYLSGPPDVQYYPPTANPAPFIPLQPQVPPPFPFPSGPPPLLMFPQSDPNLLSTPWAQTIPSQTPPEASRLFESSLSTSSSHSREEKVLETSYKDLVEKESRHSEESYRKDKRDKERHEKHHHKSKHYDREREKQRDRSHSHKERLSKDDRHEKYRERRHSSHHREKDKDKHRRDSDHEKHRRDKERRS